METSRALLLGTIGTLAVASLLVYFLVRTRSPNAPLWALAGAAAHFLGVAIARRVAASLWDDLVSYEATVRAYRAGAISYNAFLHLRDVNTRVSAGTLLVGLGCATALGLLVRHANAPEVLPPAAPDAGPDVGRSQLVGRACAACGRRVVVGRDARECAQCGAAVHHRCAHACAAPG